MDVWSDLRWISASNMTLWHQFHSSSGPEFPNLLGPTWPVSRYKGASIFLWDSIPMTQTLFTCLLWIYEVVWGGYQPQTWCYGIIFTPQVTLTSIIWWCHHGRCHGIRVFPYFLETAYQWLNYFVYVYYGCWKWSEVNISLKHNVMVSFSLLRWRWLPKSAGANLAVLRYKGATIFPCDSIPMTQKLCICLLWMYEVVLGEYQPQIWHYGIIFIPQVTLTSQIFWGRLGWCHCIRVPPYFLEPAYQWLEHFVYVYYGCMKWFEVDISLNHDVMASFSLHKGHWLPISGAIMAGVTVTGCNHTALRQHIPLLNTLCMSNKDVWSGLRWILASTIT